MEMFSACWYFKLSNNIKEEHEIDLAELELLSLFGKVERVRNFSDILHNTPFINFKETIRIQDILAHELPYGHFQGFYAEKNLEVDVSALVSRLAYIREFFIVTRSESPSSLLKWIFPLGEIDKNVQYFQNDNWCLLRFICHHYFLEKSQYISKVSRNESEVDRNVEALFSFLTKNLYRIPATVTMQVGKRLEDYFTIREEPSLYLTHYMHPYKGRFHPKMVRSLLNYVFPKKQGLVMDNFAGCGTLLVEAALMGLESIGIEINPLSALMSNVKCISLSLTPEVLKKAITSYFKELKETLSNHDINSSSLFSSSKYDKNAVDKRKTKIPKSILSMLKMPEAIDEILIAHTLAKKISDEKIRDFILLGLSGTISDLIRRRKGKFIDLLYERLQDLYLKIYLFHRLNQVLKITIAQSKTFVEDSRGMRSIRDESIDAIVTSPPYSTALDYIKNDYPQLILLELADISWLEKNMIGSPKPSIYPATLLEELSPKNPHYRKLPKQAKDIIVVLRKYGRKKETLRTYKFFVDMHETLKEMYRVMKHDSKCVIIIGNNHYLLGDDSVEVKNDEIIKQMALNIGFKEDLTIKRGLEKTKTGRIRYESIIILNKLRATPRVNSGVR
ncbi:MAG: hypothetical protein ACUVQ5_04400 [Candidatus Methanomethylicaceae archaeon]